MSASKAVEPDAAEKRRRIRVRLIGAPILIAALAGVVGFDAWAHRQVGLQAVVLAMSLAALHELFAMMRLKGLAPAWIAALVATALVHAAYSSDLSRVEDLRRALAWLRILAPAGLVVYVLIKLVFAYGRFSPADAGGTVLGFFYLGMTVALLLWRPAPADAAATWWLVFLFAANKGNDMAAYAGGKLFGRHAMAPVVSPNKTWEGAVAGLVVGAGLGAWVLLGPMRGAFRGPAWGLVVTAVATTVAAQVGDLVKSAVKRWAGVKDSGRLVPEFGGALDMIDSFILSAPVALAGAMVLR